MHALQLLLRSQRRRPPPPPREAPPRLLCARALEPLPPLNASEDRELEERELEELLRSRLDPPEESRFCDVCDPE